MGITRYTSFSKKAIENAVCNKAPRPEILECHPSPFCQLTCSYCHSKWVGINEKSVHYLNQKKNLLTIAQFANLFEEFKQLGGKYIVISGGEEPTLYPDFLELLKVCNKMDYKPHVYTNGVTKVIGDNIYNILQMISTIRISIHSSAGFDKIIGIIEYLKTIVTLDSTLLKKVYIAVYEDIFELGEKKAVKVIAEFSKIPLNIEIKNILYDTDNNENACEHNMAKICNLFTKYGASNIMLKNAGSGKAKKCYAIYRSTIIDPYGGVHICCMRAHLSDDDFGYLGNIQNQSLQKIFDKCNPFFINEYINICKICSARDYEFNKLIEKYLEISTLCM